VATDQTAFALAIQLAVDTLGSDKALDALDAKVTRIEESLQAAFSKPFTIFRNVIGDIQKNLGKVSTSFVDMDATNTNINKVALKYVQNLNDIQDNTDTQLTNFIKQNEQIDDMYKKHKNLLKIHGEELDSVTDFNKVLKGVIEGVRQKNLRHAEQNRLLAIDNDSLNEQGHNIDRNNNRLDRTLLRWGAITAAIAGAWHMIKNADLASEHFITTNYRAYGSQSDLVQQTRQLSMAWGVTNENAIEAIKTLTDLRTPQDELFKLSEIVAKTNRFTGASIPSLANFTLQMRQMGKGAADTEQHLKWMSQAMRRMGLDTNDVEKILAGASISATELRIAFGGSDRAVEGFNEIKAALMGVNKSMGMSTDIANNFMNTLAADDIARAKWGSLAGMQINTTDDLSMSMIRAGKAIRDQGADIEGLNKKAAAGNGFARKQLQVLANVYTNGDTSALLMATSVSKMAEKLKLQGNNAEDLQKIFTALKNEAMDPFSEANNTLVGQLRILNERFGAIIGTIIQLASDALVPFLKAINYVIGAIVGVVQAIGTWIAQMGKLIPGFDYFISAVKFSAGLVIALGVGILFLTTTIIGLLIGFASLGRFAITAMNVMSQMSTFIVNMATAIGRSIVIILSSIGQGFASLGRQIAPVILPIMGLGLAMVLVAGAAWIFAQAVMVIASQGAAAIPAVVGLTIAIGVLGLVLVGLGMLAQGPVAIGILAVGAGFMMVGAAALMMGAGLYLGASSLKAMAEAAGPLWTALPSLAMSIIVLGTAAYIGAPGLFLLGGAFLIVGAAALMFAGAVSIIMSSISVLDPKFFEGIGTAFVNAANQVAASAWTLAIAGVAMLAASVPLLAGAVSLGIAVTALLVSSAILWVAGAAFGTGSAMISTGIKTLSDSSKTMSETASNLLNGAIGLANSMPLLAALGGTMIPVGLAVLVGSFALSSGLVMLASAAVAILASGTSIQTGGAAILAGFQSMKEASVMMSQASHDMTRAALSVAPAMVVLVAVGVVMLSAGSTIMVGALGLLGCGTVFMAASYLISAGSQLMTPAVSGLAESFQKLSTNAGNMVAGAAGLLVASIDLLAAGYAMIPASMAMYSGLSWMDYAITKFSKSVDNVKSVSASMGLIAASFLLLNTIPANALGDVADSTLVGLGKMNQMSSQLAIVGEKFAASAKLFKDPADEMSLVLNNLSAAFNAFSTELKFADNIKNIASMIDQYASLLEKAAARIEVAIMTKAVPAMLAAERAGIKEAAVRSEAITTVQVMDKREGDDNRTNDGLAMAARTVELLESLCDKIDNMQGGSKSELNEIVSLLQTYLPAMSDRGDSGLSSQMNGWS